MGQIGSIIKIAGTIPAGLATTDARAQIDLPEDGYIWAIDSLIYFTLPPVTGSAEVTAFMLAELSFLATNQLGANDARGELTEIGVAYTYDTAAMAAKASEIRSLTLSSPIPINAGERLFAHVHNNQANQTGAFSFLLFIENRGGGRRSVRRR